MRTRNMTIVMPVARAYRNNKGPRGPVGPAEDHLSLEYTDG